MNDCNLVLHIPKLYIYDFFFFAEIEWYVSFQNYMHLWSLGNDPQSQDIGVPYFQFLVTGTPHTQIQA